MTKQEFLQGLEERLTAEGAFQLVRENREFYSNYIDGEVAKGRTEEEVLEELGDPSLIGRTILDAAGYDVDGIPDTNPASAIHSFLEVSFLLQSILVMILSYLLC